MAQKLRDDEFKKVISVAYRLCTLLASLPVEMERGRWFAEIDLHSIVDLPASISSDQENATMVVVSETLRKF